MTQETTITVTQGGPDIADGTYPMCLTKLEGPKTIVPQKGPNAGQEVDILEWTFQTQEGIELQENSSTNTGPRSKAYAWLTALQNGAAPAPGQSFRAGDLVGRWVLGQVRRDPPETGWPKIAQLMPMPTSMAQQQFARQTGAPVAGRPDDPTPLPNAVPPQTAPAPGQFVAPAPAAPVSPIRQPQDDLPF